MLHCLAVAVRPLHVKELAELLAFEFDAVQEEIPKYRPAWRLDDPTQAVLSTCSSLITIVGNHDWLGGENDSDSNCQVVQFSHFSVKEFLMSDRLTSSLGDFSQLRILPRSAHIILAQACLGLLLYEDDHFSKEGIKHLPLTRYAARYWVVHAQFEDVASCVKHAMKILFDSDKPHFAAWTGIHDSYIFYGSSVKIINPLYYSAFYGFYDLSQHLIFKSPQGVNATGGRHDFPLVAALGKGHIKVAELLLNHGADINVRVDGTTPLLALAMQFRIKEVQFLLKHHADVNAKYEDDLSTSLHAAVLILDTTRTQILLEHGADVNSQNFQGRTPLHRLIEGGCWHYENGKPNALKHTMLLLEHGADVNIQDKEHQTPLHLTMKWGRFGLIQILLAHGADANVPNNNGKTPLHLLLASEIQSEDSVLNFVQLLLEHGAELDRRDDNNETPLHLAMRRNWFVLAWILLEKGADASAVDNNGETALHLLSESWVYDVYYVRCLAQLFSDSEDGAEVEQRDSHNGKWTCYEFVTCY